MLDFSQSVHPHDFSLKPATPPRSVSKIYTWVGKRIFDIMLALLLVPIVAPAVLFLWYLVRRDGGPGFFAHTRVGQNGRLFKCWKIRSMVVDADTQLKHHLETNPKAAAEWDRDHKLSDDPRIHRLGHILRKTSLDELPQIWNVLKGDMSFVGPRPVVAVELLKYGRSAPAYIAQKPGITGVWQVSGRNGISYRERVAMDVSYVAKQSFLFDIVILAKTLVAVFLKTGR